MVCVRFILFMRIRASARIVQMYLFFDELPNIRPLFMVCFALFSVFYYRLNERNYDVKNGDLYVG